MLLPIYIYGHPILRKVSEDITADYEGLGKLIDDMFQTMYESDGVGLAAPQIGKNIRLFVIDGSAFSDIDPACKGFKKAFINAHILERSGDDVSFNEGCLSIPGIHEDVVRKDRIKITYRDENWVEHTEVFEGTQARIVQHEYDHLDGVMFTDHLAPLKKSLLKRKLNHISAGKFNIDYRFVLPK